MGIVVGTQARLVYVAETTRGVTPGTTGKVLRATSRNINLKKDTLESAEVSTSRQRADVRHGFGRIDGPIQFELGMTVYNDILAYLMARPNTINTPAAAGDTPGATPVVAADYNGWFQPSRAIDTTTAFDVTINAVTAATSTAPGTITFRLAGNGGNRNWVDLGYRPGDWVISAGWTAAQNNTSRDQAGAATSGTGPDRWRVMRIDTVAGTTSDLVCQIPAGFSGQATQTTGTATAEVDYAGLKLSIGSTLTTMSIERQFVEPTNPVYQLFPGCAINSMALDVRPDAIVGGTLNIIGGLAGLGLTAPDIDNTTAQFTTVNSAATNSPFAAFDGSVSFVSSSGTNVSGTITQLSFTVDNQRSLLPVVGARFSGDVYEGVCKITGTVTMLLDSATHLTAFQAEDPMSTMVIRLNELGTADFMSLVFCRVKYLSADIDPPQNGPVLITVPFEALEQSFTGNAGLSTIVTKEAFRIQRSTLT